MARASLIIAVIFMSLGIISCNTNKNEGSKDHETATTLDKQWARPFIDSINQKFSEEIASGDSSALASHYWPDAELLLDNSEVVKGNDIMPTWGAFIRMGAKQMTFSTTDIKGSSSLIIETGNYEIKAADSSLMDRGKYVVVWEKRNGEWKLYRDIGCTSLPAAK
jgi:ketosteroid isomerase-like protein